MVKKFARRWFGPYVVEKVNNNTTYLLRQLDGIMLRIPTFASCHLAQGGRDRWPTNCLFLAFTSSAKL